MQKTLTSFKSIIEKAWSKVWAGSEKDLLWEVSLEEVRLSLTPKIDEIPQLELFAAPVQTFSIYQNYKDHRICWKQSIVLIHIAEVKVSIRMVSIFTILILTRMSSFFTICCRSIALSIKQDLQKKINHTCKNRVLVDQQWCLNLLFPPDKLPCKITVNIKNCSANQVQVSIPVPQQLHLHF